MTEKIRLITEPLGVVDAADVERVKSLVRQALDAGAQAGYQRGVLHGLHEGYRLGLIAGSTATPDAVVSAYLAGDLARQRLAIVKDVTHDKAGRITRVVERPA